MCQSIIERVKLDRHTDYMVCAQYVNWVPAAFNRKTDDAFIVQEIQLKQEVDEKTTKTSHYYEAWHVKNGVCEKASKEDSDDLFCIGRPFNEVNELQASIGHKGRVSFIPRVFFIEKGDPLYYKIQAWPIDVVSEANGLRACYYTVELGREIEKYQEYYREPFYHEWDLTDTEKIFKNVLNYCSVMFRQSNDTDRRNFYGAIDDFFPNGANSQIKKLVIDAWENGRALL